MNVIELKRTDSDHPDFKTLVTELNHDLRMRNGEMMDIYDPYNIIEQNKTVVIAYIGNSPSGCGCFKKYDANRVEIKRMFVRHEARGKGISKMVLTALEDWARDLGFSHTVLETGGKQTEALGLYPSAGYQLIPNYEPYIGLPDSICFKKAL